jgi:hypothetical protein
LSAISAGSVRRPGSSTPPCGAASARYTGRQVWNKQRTGEVLIDVEDIALGHENKHRWNDRSDDWVWSKAEAHEPLIPSDLYERAQGTVKTRGTHSDVGRAPRRSVRPYLLRGLITWGLCDRKMVGNPNHGRLYYRCKASRDYVRQHEVAHPPGALPPRRGHHRADRPFLRLDVPGQHT